jgi:hypothetical protein
MRPLCFVIGSLIFLPASVRAQDVASGPEKGKKVPALSVFDATGESKGKEVDYAAERKDKPTIYVVIMGDKFDRPMARFLKKLDEEVKKESDDAALIAVWLTDDVDKSKERLPLIQQSLQLQVTPLTCFTGDKAGPKDWNINGDAHLTAVVANKGKVFTNLGYQSINETDVKAVKEALAKARKGK